MILATMIAAIEVKIILATVAALIIKTLRRQLEGYSGILKEAPEARTRSIAGGSARWKYSKKTVNGEMNVGGVCRS